MFAWVLGPRGAVPLPLQPRSGKNGVDRRPGVVRIDLQPDGAPDRGRGGDRRARRRGIAGIARPLLFATIAPDTAAARGVPVGVARRARSSSCSASTRARRPRPSARSSCSGSSRRRPGAAMRLTAEPMHGLALSVASRSPRSGPGSRRLPDPDAPAEQRDHRRRRRDLRRGIRSTCARRSSGSRSRRRGGPRRGRRPRSPRSPRPGGSPSRARILERLDLAAGVADEVMMVLAARVRRLVARDARAEIDPLDAALRGEQVEHAVDARDPDTAVPRPGAGRRSPGRSGSSPARRGGR